MVKMRDELSQPLVSNDVTEDTEEQLLALRDQLHAAVTDNSVREVRRLLHRRDRAGAALVFPDSDQCGITPLHRACQLGLPHMVQLLIAEGANVDYRDGTGRTPLHYACTEFSAMSPDTLRAMLVCRRVCVKLLMQAGADPRAVDHNNETPIDLALKPAQFVPFPFPLLSLLCRSPHPLLLCVRAQNTGHSHWPSAWTPRSWCRSCVRTRARPGTRCGRTLTRA